MSIDFFRNYQFPAISASIIEAQKKACSQPCETWEQLGKILYDLSWYNGTSILAVGADIASYLFVSSFRKVGLLLPTPPAPPVFPNPHDNVEFIDNAIRRALWNWDPALRTEMNEGIEDGLADRWNIYAVIGEWAFAYSLENGANKDYYKPTFLTIAEGLSNGATFPTISTAFSKLKQKEKDLILTALYRQEKMPTLSAAGKKVYQDVRAFASLLQQGNKNYLEAFGEYQKNKAAGTLRNLTPADVAPTAQRVAAASAPVLQPQAPQIVNDVCFFREAVMEGANTCSGHLLITSIQDDNARPLAHGNHPETLMSSQPQASLKYFVARLGLLRLFKEAFQKNRSTGWPQFFPWQTTLRNGQDLRAAGQMFAMLSDHDFAQLRQAIVNPSAVALQGALRTRLLELSELADKLHRNEDFLRVYEMLRANLI